MTLAVLFISAGGLYAFAEIADQVADGETHRVDRAILHVLRNPNDPHDPIGPAWLEIMFKDITALGGYTVAVMSGLVALAYLATIRQWGSALLVVVSIAGGSALNAALKHTFDRSRPELVAHLVEVQTASFPSGHAMLSAVTFLTLGALIARAQPRKCLKALVLGVAMGLTIAVGMSRIYLGVHWPTDVIAGWCIGAAWAMACWVAAHWLQRRR